MSLKENYSPSDWETLKNSFFWVFQAIAKADNRIDRKETHAFEIFVDNAGKFKSVLVNEVLVDVKESGVQSKLGGSFTNYRHGLEETAGILKNTDQQTALDFKKHLIAFGAYIGDSSGKFFDFKFSEEEEEALNNVGNLLGISVRALLLTKTVDRLIDVIKE